MEKTSIAIAADSIEARNAVKKAAHRRGLEVILERTAGADLQAFVEDVSRLRPSIIFVEVSRLSGPLDRTVQALQSIHGTPSVVAVHTSPNPEAILEAMRAGAAEFVYPPFDLNTDKSLERLLLERDGRRRTAAGKTLGFLSVKGGCGATTIACQMAAEFHRTCSKSVLLADFDADLGTIGFLLKARSQYSVADALQRAERLDHSMWQAFAASGPSGISVLTAAEEPALAPPDPDQSADFFRFVRSEYDFTVVDLGRGMTRSNITVMADIDCTCLVTTMEISALHHARRTIRTLLNGGATSERLRLIVNRMPRRQEVSVAELEKMIDFPVYATVAEDAHAVSDACFNSGMISPGTTIGRQIAAIAGAWNGQPEKEQRKFRLFARASS